jgi:protein-disulfide isomerase
MKKSRRRRTAKVKSKNRAAQAQSERRKQLLTAGMTVAALMFVGLLVFLGAQSRKSGSQVTTEVLEVETGITEDGFPYQGAPDAPVKLVEYSDYLCGHCASFALETEPRLVEEYVATGQVQYIYHYYALQQTLLAEASHCAADQGHFWEYHRLMFASQDRFGSISTMEELQALLVEFAEQVGLDTSEFETCWNSHRHQDAIIESATSAQEDGVAYTPTFSIQGELFVGNQPYEAFQQAIEASLAGEAGSKAGQ